MVSDRIVEDSSATKKSLPNYLVDHNLSIARQCIHVALTLLPHMEDRATTRQEVTQGGATNIDDPRIQIEFRHAAEIIQEILSLLKDLDKSLCRQPVDIPFANSDVAENGDCDMEFRRALVDLMVLTVQCWEQASGRDKIDLAEKSRLWKVSNDNSQLRVRTMERYLSIKKLPKLPRWQTVLDTAYFVLNQNDGNLPVARQLAVAVDNTVALLRSRALL